MRKRSGTVVIGIPSESQWATRPSLAVPSLPDLVTTGWMLRWYPSETLMHLSCDQPASSALARIGMISAASRYARPIMTPIGQSGESGESTHVMP